MLNTKLLNCFQLTAFTLAYCFHTGLLLAHWLTACTLAYCLLGQHYVPAWTPTDACNDSLILFSSKGVLNLVTL